MRYAYLVVAFFSHLHLCKGVVSFQVAHLIDSQLQVRVVAFKIMWIVVGLVVG